MQGFSFAQYKTALRSRFVLVAALVLLASASPRQQERSEANHHGSHSDPFIAATGLQVTAGAPEQPKDPQSQPPDPYEEISAAFTGINWSNWALLFAAIWGGSIALRTLKAIRREVRQTKKAADAARDAVLFAHRPDLVLRHIVVNGIDQGTIGDLVDGYAWLTNTGALEVTLLGFHAEWLTTGKLPIENPLLKLDTTAITPVKLGPSHVTKQQLPDRQLNTLEEHIAFWGDEETVSKLKRNIRAKTLFLIGSFKWSDSIGLRRRYFCYRYSISQNRFVEEPHPNYSYED